GASRAGSGRKRRQRFAPGDAEIAAKGVGERAFLARGDLDPLRRGIGEANRPPVAESIAFDQEHGGSPCLASSSAGQNIQRLAEGRGLIQRAARLRET